MLHLCNRQFPNVILYDCKYPAHNIHFCYKWAHFDPFDPRFDPNFPKIVDLGHAVRIIIRQKLFSRLLLNMECKMKMVGMFFRRKCTKKCPNLKFGPFLTRPAPFWSRNGMFRRFHSLKSHYST